MGYTQSQNPFSRKSSSPFKMKGPDGKRHKDMSKEEKAAHKAAKHPSKRDPEAADEMRYEDNTQAANQPMGPERRSSQSPLNSHGEKDKALTAEIEAMKKKHYERNTDPFEDPAIQAKIAERTKLRASHKEDGPSRKSSSPVNFMGIKRPGRCTPFPNPDCEPGTPQYNLAKRLKPGGDLYKGKKNK